jgi:hypothetical protein
VITIRGWSGLVLAMLLLATPCLAAGQPNAAQQAMVKAFRDHVFVALPGDKQKIVLKWQSPVRFGLVSREGVTSRLYYDTLARIEEMREASGEHFVVSSDRINFLVLFSTNTAADVKAYGQQIAPFFSDGIDYHGYFDDYQKKGLTCAGKMLLAPTRRIIAYLLFVSVLEDRSLDDVEACVSRNLLRGMGILEQPAAEAAPTERFKAGALSRLDKQMLAVLYNDAIKSGEPESAAEKTILTIPVPK